MNYAKCRVFLDVQKSASGVSIDVKRGDTGRQLLISLTDNGKPYRISEECYAVFTAQKPDGNKVMNACSIEDGVIGYILTPQSVAAAGELPCEIKVYGGDDCLLTTASFTIVVHDTVLDAEDAIESETEVEVLTQLISDAAVAVSESNRLIGEMESALDTWEEMGSGTVESWNDLKDRPFYEENGAAQSYHWDGNRESLTYTEPAIFRVSDRLPKPEELIDAAVTISKSAGENGVGGAAYTYHIEESMVTAEQENALYTVRTPGGEIAVYIVYYAVSGIEKGLYLAAIGTDSWTSGLSYTAEAVLKQLDEKFIPDTIARVSDIPEIPESSGGVSSWNDLTDKPFCEENGEVVKQLDEKFIPDSIARTADIPTDEHINELISAKLAEATLVSAEEVAF